MDRWIWRFAARDTRGNRGRLLLFVSSMVLGVAALVSINSFGDNLKAAIDQEARTLLGADLSLESGSPFNERVEAIIDSLGGTQSRRTSFASMAFFPRTGSSRLVTVRGNQEGFPFYGAVETDPPEAATSYLESGGALIDGTLMQQYDIVIGDSMRIGGMDYRVEGRLLQTPRESAAVMLFSPRVYVPLARLDTTLLAAGSRADYEVYFRFEDERDADAAIEPLQSELRGYRVGTDTVEEERENWNAALTNLYRFLGLVGFTALLLGSLGVASSISVYVRQRIQTIAVLRCYGASVRSTVWVYVFQAAGMGLFGAFLGSGLGVLIQTLIPQVLADFLPVDVDFRVSWPAVFMGSGIGLGVTLLFALLPLLSLRDVSPLMALRSGVETGPRRKGWAWWATVGVIGLGTTGFAVAQAPSVGMGLGYAGAILIVFLLLAGTARLLMAVLSRRPPVGVSYTIKQGIANLHRPNNQTLTMMLALGLGTFLVTTMLVSEDTLVSQITVAGDTNRPNLIFYDIQPAQVEPVRQVVMEQGLPILEQTLIVTMRIHAVGDRTVQELREDSTARATWAHRREYRSTFRDHLTDSETLVSGIFTPAWSGEGAIPVSVEQDVANELAVDIGDSIVFDIQGILVPTVVGSIRTVDWRRMQTNFFVVFPAGSLDAAPAMHVIMTRTDTEAQSAQVQSAVVRQLPSVSAIDLSLILNTFEAIFSRIAFVARFMALFSVLTGMIVLAGAVLISRFQRIEESVLLKTLGASRKTVLRIMSVEYLVLGFAASLTGILLALAAGWSISIFVFDAPLSVPFASVGIIMASVVVLTLVIGHLNSRGVYDRSALDVLRSEV
ncbi:MAG: ABC transporter permease [Bacteroidetes bacterium]|nr:ABC transporter permease [Bacteroidota bacterium]MDA0873547.1 ABC transporter permease [Bacteroidota bacterium]